MKPLNACFQTFLCVEPDDTVEVPEGRFSTTITTIDDHKVTGWVSGGRGPEHGLRNLCHE